MFVTISCKNRLINKKHPSNFPKYLSPRPSTEAWYCSNRDQDKPEFRRRSRSAVAACCCALASVVFRFEELWVLTLPLTQLPLTQASDTPLLSLQHLYCLEGCNYPVGGLPQILQHYETFSLSSHFILNCDRV